MRDPASFIAPACLTIGESLVREPSTRLIHAIATRSGCAIARMRG